MRKAESKNRKKKKQDVAATDVYGNWQKSHAF